MNPASFSSSSSSPLHFIDLNLDDDHQHLIRDHQHSIITTTPQPHEQQSTSSQYPSPCFFDLTGNSYQSGSFHTIESLRTKNKVEKCAVIGDRSSDESISKRPDKSVGHKFNDHHMQEMNPTNYNDQFTCTEIVRICSDCNTTKTPLWRGGPQGPKSLCNACGIRQRKARKAMELAAAAANPTQTSHSPTNDSKTHINKQKKSRKSYAPQHKQYGTCPNNNSRKHPSFEDFGVRLISKNNNSTSFQDHLFPKDEEEVAAILLMALSCGFMHH